MTTDKKRTNNPALHLNMPFEKALERFAQTDPKELDAGDTDGPIPLVEDEDTGDRFLIYHSKNGAEVELQVEGDTFWATQRQMADAFGVTQQNISLHLLNIYKEGELSEEATYKESLHVGRDGKPRTTKLYDLNALISVGYRTGGKAGTQFRIWATGKLLQYLTRGFVVDSERLKEQGNQDRITELREVVRDIRAAEANVYAELKRICAMCQDYDPQSKDAHEFYARMQAKLYWATVSHTPSEVIKSRADAREPNMGLQTWKRIEIVQTDATTAKNYLAGAELEELNRLTTLLLDIFDDQLKLGKIVLMAEAAALLDKSLSNLSRRVLRHGGSVRHDTAEAHAKAEYRKFDDRRRVERAERTQRELATLKATGNSLAKVGGKAKSSKNL